MHHYYSVIKGINQGSYEKELEKHILKNIIIAINSYFVG